MTKVVVDISMSLDGLITEPNEGVQNPLGDDPGRLHITGCSGPSRTTTPKPSTRSSPRRERFGLAGECSTSERNLGEIRPRSRCPYSCSPTQREPIPKKGGTTYHFASSGIADALAQARAAAGNKNVSIWGGAKIVQEYLKAGLVDEMQIHLIAVLLGEGVRLFELMGRECIDLRLTRTIQTPGATHLRFAVIRGSAQQQS